MSISGKIPNQLCDLFNSPILEFHMNCELSWHVSPAITILIKDHCGLNCTSKNWDCKKLLF